jgi:hypothetical protein
MSQVYATATSTGADRDAESSLDSATHFAAPVAVVADHIPTNAPGRLRTRRGTVTEMCRVILDGVDPPAADMSATVTRAAFNVMVRTNTTALGAFPTHS